MIRHLGLALIFMLIQIWHYIGSPSGRSILEQGKGMQEGGELVT